jgi:hypothetical protein
MKRPVCLAAALLLAVAPALAQKKVFRCTEAGRTVYSDAPCKDATEIKADDSRSEAQRQAAREAVRAEAKATEAMARERRTAELAASRQGAGQIPYSAARQAAAPTPVPAASGAHKPGTKKAKPAQP